MFTNTKALAIPEGDVVKIECDGVVLWELPSSYKNQIPYSIDTDKSIFNGKGYVDSTRLSSSGATKTASNCITTGYIKAKSNDIIRISGVTWKAVQSGVNYVCCYDSNFNFVCAVNSNGYYGGGTVGGDSNVATVTLLDDITIAYVRVSIHHQDVDASTLIVTVNEEIT